MTKWPTFVFLFPLLIIGQLTPHTTTEASQDANQVIYVKKIEQSSVHHPIDSSIHTQTSITINVANKGCTDAKSFKIHVKNHIEYSQVVIERVQEDFCKGYFPSGLDLVINTEKISLYQKIQFVTNGNNKIILSEEGLDLNESEF